MTLLKRMALVIDDGVIGKVFYPVFPPDKSADEVVAWLRSGWVSMTRGPGGLRHMLGVPCEGQPMAACRLHYFPESGNSYKLALMLTLCGQTFEPVWTDFGGGVTRTAEWRRQVNQMGEIPVLEDSGKRHTQTAPILLRLAERYGRFGWQGRRRALRNLALALLG